VPLVLLLVVVTVVAAGYFVVNRSSGGSSTPQDFGHTAERLAQEARSIPTLATHVQRFTELRAFDQGAGFTILAMERDSIRLRQIATSASGARKTVADQAVSAAVQALNAATRYQHAVAYTYRLDKAALAREDLNAATATLDQQAKAWAHA
jgi:hypothetical protein